MAEKHSTGIAAAVPAPALAYVRMSDDRQADSPDQQRAEITKLAERGGYQILRWYIAEGISGDDTGRRVAFPADAQRPTVGRLQGRAVLGSRQIRPV